MTKKNARIDPADIISPRLYRDTLCAINYLRKLGGKKPLRKIPTGQFSDEYGCPIFRALRDIGINSADEFGANGHIRLLLTDGSKAEIDLDYLREIHTKIDKAQDVIGRFITKFDNQNPELEEVDLIK